ncbi:SDR family oxidoreductase [Leptospira langatensis]|uniref:SDR family oxidoreductase n=1 Tax=Leptospira langatensis TaxID=2484983 RepID=A0A5F1ZVS6_9LEPT|nr:SDR family oxidoreductase [Leptospira langatensis]TGK02932.1 SDR family oxidoreductase [Leptospira langatensis]TGL41687.1 SDR family oxidoreductase [Leptospira langatensis]
MGSYFQDKVFLVTGASSGIGKALAIALEKEGAFVGVVARRKDALKELKSSAGNPDRIMVLQADVTSESELKKIVEEFKKKFKRIDGFIHNAGITMRALASETEVKVFRTIMDTNYFPLVILYRLLEEDLRQSEGHVIAISSVQGKFATQYRSGYAASKHAVQAFMDSIRLENSKSGIHVMTVSPGFVKTDISVKALSGDGSPHGIMDEGQKKGLAPEKIARSVLKGMEKKKREIYPSRLKEKLGLFLSRFSPKTLDRFLLKSRVT